MHEEAARPAVLILANRFDFTCDYVAAALRRRAVTYLRLNSEDLQTCALTLDPAEPTLSVELSDARFLLTSESLRSVLFRRPVFLRDYGDDSRSAQERFARIQWAAFMRNLMLFERARWYNPPDATYRAEHKALQLYMATKLGMRVPRTIVTNTPLQASASLPGESYVVKGLDTVMVRESGEEFFGFTTFAEKADLDNLAWRSAPAILQEPVAKKTDLRVTVIDGHVFTAEILVAGSGVSDDWRLHKREAQFVRHLLPEPVSRQCVELVAALGLRFGAIDLALADGIYYFLEINPTGEWAWLVDAAGLPIDEAVADALAS